MTDTEVQEEVVAPVPAKNSARKIILVSLAILFLLYAYEVVADRVTPYTSQASVDTFLVKVAPQVTGQVVSVGVIDNGPVKKGQVMFRIDPQPFEIAVSKAQADLAVALQASQVSSVEINVAQAALLKQKEDLAASRTLGRIVTNLVDKRALAETNAIRARADTAKTVASVAQAGAEVERAKRNAGPSGNANPKVRQALAYALPYQKIIDVALYGRARPLFGGREVTCGFTGSYSADAADVNGTALVGKTSVVFHAKLALRSEL